MNILCNILFHVLKVCVRPKESVRLEKHRFKKPACLAPTGYCVEKKSKPQLTQCFRFVWVILSLLLSSWKSTCFVIQPETVIRWHRTSFRLFWKRRSRGRPHISPQTIALIKRTHKENPLLSPEKIHEQLLLLNVTDTPTPNTIAKYLPLTRKPPSEKQLQSWKTFLHNHNVWSMDFCIVPTIRFKMLYVFVIISHSRRRLEHVAVTSNPNVSWLKQQIREATPYGHQPKYLLHDNDPLFTSRDFEHFLTHANITSVRTSYRSPWQNAICERMVGILRRELLDHIIPFNETHLRKHVQSYMRDYYNTHRTHQGIGGQTPEISAPPTPTLSKDTKLVAKPILGGLYQTYEKVA